MGKKKQRQWNVKAAEKAFQKNKALVESGETYRSHKPNKYHLGASTAAVGKGKAR